MNKIECQVFWEKLNYLLADFDRVALLTSAYETVFLKYASLSDIGTLSQSAETSNKYLSLQDGDIVLLNDPYSGGSILSSPTLILGIGNRQVKGQTPAEYLVAARFTMLPLIRSHQSIDEEGLRIPPSPFFIKGELNRPILEALKSHPLAPANFTELLVEQAHRLLELRETMKARLGNGDLDLSRPAVRQYLQTTEREFVRRLDELGEGSSVCASEINETELIKLKVDHIDGHFTFDFNGTSDGQNVFLTYSATIGACVGATVSMLGLDIPLNSGVFSRFDVKAPRGSLVNSTFPRPVLLGHIDGVCTVANMVVKAFGQIHKKHACASSGVSHCLYQIRFSNGSALLDVLPIGTGARESRGGLNGVLQWWRLNCEVSLEEWESTLPLQVLNTGFRSNSGGDGPFLGGNGAVRSIKILADGELNWSHIRPHHKPEGLNGGKSALGPEMILQRSDGKKIELSNIGVMKVSAGDILTVLSAGGGGYGTKPT